MTFVWTLEQLQPNYLSVWRYDLYATASGAMAKLEELRQKFGGHYHENSVAGVGVTRMFLTMPDGTLYRMHKIGVKE